MSRLISFILFLCLVWSVSGYNTEFVVVDNNRECVDSLRVTAYDERMDSLFVSANQGCIVQLPEHADIRYVVIESPLYSATLIDLLSLRSDTIVMKEVNALNEVSVTDSQVEQHLTYTTYRIPMKEMRRYDTFYQALNEIPNLVVLSSGDLFYEGSNSVKLLLNGVETSRQEVSALAKEDISKINISTTPNARYAAEGYTSVIDIITKSDITGGNGSINISQSVVPVKGENSAALFYNFKRSRFSFLYTNENSHFDEYQRSENLDYNFGGVDYFKHKEGLDSEDDVEDNQLSFAFQNNKSGSYLYNASVDIGFNRESGNYFQRVNTTTDNFYGNNRIYTRYNSFSVKNYFEKTIGEDGKYGTAMANVRFLRYNTRYFSAYREYDAPESFYEPTIDENSFYKTRCDVIMGEIQYQFPYFSWGRLFFDAYDTYQHSKYTDFSKFFQKTNSTGLSLQYFKGHKSFFYNVDLGLQYNYTASSLMEHSYRDWKFTPTVRVYYTPKRNMQARLSYSFSENTPSISQLSETDQWLDYRLVYHGNARLSPYKTHTIGLMAVGIFKYIEASLNAIYVNSPGRICDYYTLSDNYMLQTMINLDDYQELTGQLDMTVKPLGNRVWTIWNRVIGAKLWGENPNYHWHGYRFQWMFETSVNLDQWTITAFYQYPGKIAEGQLIRPRAQSWSIGASYRPFSGFSVGLKWRLPFGKYFKESERSVNTALVHNETITKIDDWANMFVFNLSWNFSFGRNKNREEPQFDNYSSDSGILKK